MFWLVFLRRNVISICIIHHLRSQKKRTETGSNLKLEERKNQREALVASSPSADNYISQQQVMYIIQHVMYAQKGLAICVRPSFAGLHNDNKLTLAAAAAAVRPREKPTTIMIRFFLYFLFCISGAIIIQPTCGRQSRRRVITCDTPPLQCWPAHTDGQTPSSRCSSSSL